MKVEILSVLGKSRFELFYEVRLDVINVGVFFRKDFFVEVFFVI